MDRLAVKCTVNNAIEPMFSNYKKRNSRGHQVDADLLDVGHHKRPRGAHVVALAQREAGGRVFGVQVALSDAQHPHQRFKQSGHVRSLTTRSSCQQKKDNFLHQYSNAAFFSTVF